jgi:hypothetical protein
MTDHGQSKDDIMTTNINLGIARAAAEGRVIDAATARRIAAATHRGLDSELARFAGSGRLERFQVARLELHQTVKGEPQLAPWAKALTAYLTARQRQALKQRSRP